jgi:sugar lactone lactonase YvrE
MSYTRRSFAATLAGAPAVFSQRKIGIVNPILGAGDYQYECIHDWGEVPSKIAYGNTHSVVEDSEGFIWVQHTVHASSPSDDTLLVFDPKGKFVRSMGPEFKGGAHGLHIRKEGSQDFLYISDTKNARVVKMSAKGEKVWEIGYPDMAEPYQPGPDGKKKKYSPTNVAIAPNGDVYVADGYGSHYVNQYDKNAKYIRTIATPGKEPGQLNNPHGIIVDERGKATLLVADRGNNRLQFMTLEGQHLSFAGNVKKPCHFQEQKGVLLIPDLDARVTLLDKENRLIAHLGEDTSGQHYELRKRPRTEFIVGKFVCPHGACFDRHGNIFVAEWVEVGRITKLRKV